MDRPDLPAVFVVPVVLVMKVREFPAESLFRYAGIRHDTAATSTSVRKSAAAKPQRK